MTIEEQSLKASARELRKLRDAWKSDKQLVDAMTANFGTEADATQREIHEHFQQLHVALYSREAALVRDVIVRQARRTDPLIAKAEVSTWCTRMPRVYA